MADPNALLSLMTLRNSRSGPAGQLPDVPRIAYQPTQGESSLVSQTARNPFATLQAVGARGDRMLSGEQLVGADEKRALLLMMLQNILSQRNVQSSRYSDLTRNIKDIANVIGEVPVAQLLKAPTDVAQVRQDEAQRRGVAESYQTMAEAANQALQGGVKTLAGDVTSLFPELKNLRDAIPTSVQSAVADDKLEYTIDLPSGQAKGSPRAIARAGGRVAQEGAKLSQQMGASASSQGAPTGAVYERAQKRVTDAISQSDRFKSEGTVYTTVGENNEIRATEMTVSDSEGDTYRVIVTEDGKVFASNGTPPELVQELQKVK